MGCSGGANPNASQQKSPIVQEPSVNSRTYSLDLGLKRGKYVALYSQLLVGERLETKGVEARNFGV